MEKTRKNGLSRENVNAIVLMLMFQGFSFVGNYVSKPSPCCSLILQQPYPGIYCQQIVDNSSVDCLRSYLLSASSTYPIMQLELQTSNISVLPDDFFNSFNVVGLQLVSCGLAAVPVDLLRHACPIISGTLGFATNRIESIPDGTFSSCTQITSLDLSDNLISVISTNAFQGASAKLISIYLHQNMLTSVSPDAFRNMNSLVLITLNKNRIVTMLEGTFLVPLLQSVYLEGNAFTCNCSLHWLQNWMRQDDVVSDNPQCFWPPIGPIISANFCPINQTSTIPHPVTNTTSKWTTAKLPFPSTNNPSVPPTIKPTPTSSPENSSIPSKPSQTPTTTPISCAISNFTLSDDLTMYWTSSLSRVMILYGPTDTCCSPESIHSTFGNTSTQMHLVVTENADQYQAAITSSDDTTDRYLACVTRTIDLDQTSPHNILDDLICDQNCKTTSKAPKMLSTYEPSTESGGEDVVSLVLVSALCGVIVATIIIGGLACYMRSRRKKKMKQLERKLLFATPYQPKSRNRTPPTIVEVEESDTDAPEYIEPSQINVNVAARKRYRIKAKEAVVVAEALQNSNSYLSLEPNLYLTLTEAGYYGVRASSSDSCGSYGCVTEDKRKRESGSTDTTSSIDSRFKIWIADRSCNTSTLSADQTHCESFSQSSRNQRDFLY